MARKKGERHGGDGARKEPHAAEEQEEGRAGATENGARRGGTAEHDTGAAAAAPPCDTAAAESKDEALRRAEQLVDEWGARLGDFASQAGQQALRLAARAREEVEDIWAEAQSIRRGEGGQVSAEELAGGAPQTGDQEKGEPGARLGRVAYGLGQQLRQLATRAREEAQSIWADAQNVRRGQAASPPTEQKAPGE